MELIVVMVIFSILAAMGVSGYMGTLQVERRQDAVVSMQNLLISINTAARENTVVCPTTSNDFITFNNNRQFINTQPCNSSGGFYEIRYHDSGIDPLPPAVAADTDAILTNTEQLILEAVGLRRQVDDFEPGRNDCRRIYLSNLNKIYPTYCR